jgi:hypothetical protein
MGKKNSGVEILLKKYTKAIKEDSKVTIFFVIWQKSKWIKNSVQYVMSQPFYSFLNVRVKSYL